MSSYLVALNGPDAGKKIFLVGQEFVIGRHPECDIIVEVGAVSRYHAKITRVDGKFKIEDLGSRNGTFVNDVQLTGPHILQHGDSIRVCDVSFEYKIEGHKPSPMETVGIKSEGQGAFGAVMVDDDGATSTIMSKFEVSSQSGSIHLTASPEVKLNALLQITRELTGTLSMEEVLPKVLDGLFHIFLQADRGFIIMMDASGNMVPRWTKARREDDEEEIRISRTIVKHVMKTREAILSADAAADSRFEMSQSITDFKIRSIMCAPLVNADDEVIGVIQIDTLDQRKRFQKEDLEVLVSVGMQAAAAIERAQLHDAAIRQISFQRDLHAANQVQIGFLPSADPLVEGYRFAHYYLAANSVGGDYYDYISLPDGTTAILVGDVVGHGIAASLMMAKLSAEARYCLASDADPQKAAYHLNNDFAAATPDDKFVTLAIAILNPASNEITLINAGHNPPILRKADGTCSMIFEEEIGLPLGIMEDMEYDVARITLKPGEMLFIYTDGINEAMNAQGDQFGMERMMKCVSDNQETVDVISEAIIQECRAFMAGSPQYDDMCMVGLERQA
ncbi:FHA domain-containing protein [Bremerella cremea]|uniref:Protein serine phosphatase n=1 Tax=Blastopirellula marina TaxID=124 RepID=A0A2S8FQF8_9BACT|nr:MULTISPECIES: SpoIIE family protein phosphatase [Pirellulaceae]PQO34423.1 protein serine phosphatase [Blastopirellula marina]RCS46919.1 FHA domain-containing protein [Bremerella cremea]